MPPAASLGDCGSWGEPENYKIRWDLSAFHGRAGWIIQEILNPAFTMKCPKVADCGREVIHYWEGWYFDGKGIYVGKNFDPIPPLGAHDYFGDGKECSCHNGTKGRLGWAKFCEVDKQCGAENSAWGWKDGGGFDKSPRGTLMGGPKPSGWDQSNTFPRSLTAQAQCCKTVFVPICPPQTIPVCDPKPTTLT